MYKVLAIMCASTCILVGSAPTADTYGESSPRITLSLETKVAVVDLAMEAAPESVLLNPEMRTGFIYGKSCIFSIYYTTNGGKLYFNRAYKNSNTGKILLRSLRYDQRLAEWRFATISEDSAVGRFLKNQIHAFESRPKVHEKVMGADMMNPIDISSLKERPELADLLK